MGAAPAPRSPTSATPRLPSSRARTHARTHAPGARPRARRGLPAQAPHRRSECAPLPRPRLNPLRPYPHCAESWTHSRVRLRRLPLRRWRHGLRRLADWSAGAHAVFAALTGRRCPPACETSTGVPLPPDTPRSFHRGSPALCTGAPTTNSSGLSVVHRQGACAVRSPRFGVAPAGGRRGISPARRSVRGPPAERARSADSHAGWRCPGESGSGWTGKKSKVSAVRRQHGYG